MTQKRGIRVGYISDEEELEEHMEVKEALEEISC